MKIFLLHVDWYSVITFTSAWSTTFNFLLRKQSAWCSKHHTCAVDMEHEIFNIPGRDIRQYSASRLRVDSQRYATASHLHTFAHRIDGIDREIQWRLVFGTQNSLDIVIVLMTTRPLNGEQRLPPSAWGRRSKTMASKAVQLAP